jgi:predicted GIY-YIG superfamily endonuclease
MPRPKCYVYVLKSLVDSTRSFSGVTRDWRALLDAHNAGKCAPTADARPWAIDLLVPFSDDARAAAFERYVKSDARRLSRTVR